MLISGAILVLHFHFQSIFVSELFSGLIFHNSGCNWGFLFHWWGFCIFLVFFVGGNGSLTGRVRHASYSPMAGHGKTVCLSTVSEEDLTSSDGALSAGATIPPPHDFVHRFCRKRANYFCTKNTEIIADSDDFLRGIPSAESAIYKDFIRQKHRAWFVPPVVSSDIPSSLSTTVKEAAETHTTDSARQQVLFIDSAVREVSRLFSPSGESPDSSAEGSQCGSPRLLPWPNRGVSPHSRGVVASSASGFQVNRPAGNHSTSGAPDLHDLMGFMPRLEDILKDTHRQSDLTRGLGDGLQSSRQDYQQSFA